VRTPVDIHACPWPRRRVAPISGGRGGFPGGLRQESIMRTSLFAPVILVAAVSFAPAAAAVPDCAQVGVTTTLCTRPGHAQLSTYPAPMNYGPWQWWQWGGGGFYFGW